MLYFVYICILWWFIFIYSNYFTCSICLQLHIIWILTFNLLNFYLINWITYILKTNKWFKIILLYIFCYKFLLIYQRVKLLLSINPFDIIHFSHLLLNTPIQLLIFIFISFIFTFKLLRNHFMPIKALIVFSYCPLHFQNYNFLIIDQLILFNYFIQILIYLFIQFKN